MTTEQLVSIFAELDQFDDFISNVDLADEELTFATAVANHYDTIESELDSHEPVVALMQHTGEVLDEAYLDISRGTYLVLPDDEADVVWERYLDDYLDECVLPELPESAQHYFDRESWLNDARMDGRGHSLSTYDGSEHEETVNGTTYYIYRQ